jgi:hypothetical protein
MLCHCAPIGLILLQQLTFGRSASKVGALLRAPGLAHAVEDRRPWQPPQQLGRITRDLTRQARYRASRPPQTRSSPPGNPGSQRHEHTVRPVWSKPQRRQRRLRRG